MDFVFMRYQNGESQQGTLVDPLDDIQVTSLAPWRRTPSGFMVGRLTTGNYVNPIL